MTDVQKVDIHQAYLIIWFVAVESTVEYSGQPIATYTYPGFVWLCRDAKYQINTDYQRKPKHEETLD